MKTARIVLLTAGLWLASGAAAWAGVTVNYIKPDEFTDVPRSPTERDEVLANLTRYWQELGARLPAGQDLTIDITDVDLAGRIEPARGPTVEIRVLRGGADWPRIDLHYTLSAHGKTLRSSTARLSDMTYLDHLNTNFRSDPLRYEKQMISDWFGKEFGEAKHSP